MAIEEHVVLVDDDDRETGAAEKIDAHRAGLLHRAFSVIVWNSQGQQLLQRRALSKYHSAGLWTNTCCGHPRPGEHLAAAAVRRLGEEMGFTCTLEETGTVRYRAAVGNGLTEHEIVHILRGRYDGPVRPDPLEADAYDWRSPGAIQSSILAAPADFTVWYRTYVTEQWPVTRPPL